MPPRRLLRSVLLLAPAAMALLVTACRDGATYAEGDAASGPRGDITVFAASSLTDAFQDVARDFEAAHPGARVHLNFAASSALALQVREGAPADVFASADQAQMKSVVDAGDAHEAPVFTANVPVIVVPAGSTAVQTFEDLANPGLKLILAAPEVPIGRYSRAILANASASGGISPDFSERALRNVRSEESNVRAVLAKVELGEADAGIVYATDVPAAGEDVRLVEISARYNVTATYPIAALTSAPNPGLAAAFVDYVLSPEGQSILAKHGFVSP